MNLSEAIRLGSMLGPQIVGELYRNGGTCALGSAYLALSANGTRTIWSYYPWTGKPGICPVCKVPRFCYASVITHLNDDHLWTREAIAGWVATVEPPDAAIMTEEPELVEAL